MTSHLSGLNSIDQVDSHSSSLCRSDCKVSESDLEFIVSVNRYTMVSSAYRRALLKPGIDMILIRSPGDS